MTASLDTRNIHNKYKLAFRSVFLQGDTDIYMYICVGERTKVWVLPA